MRTLSFCTACSIVAATLAAGPAFAGADSGFYLGAGVGQAYIDDVEGFSGFDGDDTGWKLIGGYNFGIVPLIDLAGELAYVDFGKPDEDGAEVDASAAAVFGLVGVNLGPVGVFGKVGVFSWDADLGAGSLSASDDGTDVAYGIGARFQIASFQIRGEYELFNADAADLSLLSASLLYTF